MTKREGLRKYDFLESYVGIFSKERAPNRNSFSAGSLRLEPKLVQHYNANENPQRRATVFLISIAKNPSDHQQSICVTARTTLTSIDTPTLCKRVIWALRLSVFGRERLSVMS